MRGSALVDSDAASPERALADPEVARAVDAYRIAEKALQATVGEAVGLESLEHKTARHVARLKELEPVTERQRAALSDASRALDELVGEATTAKLRKIAHKLPPLKLKKEHPVPEKPAKIFACACGYESPTGAGLAAHQRHNHGGAPKPDKPATAPSSPVKRHAFDKTPAPPARPPLDDERPEKNEDADVAIADEPEPVGGLNEGLKKFRESGRVELLDGLDELRVDLDPFGSALDAIAAAARALRPLPAPARRQLVSLLAGRFDGAVVDAEPWPELGALDGHGRFVPGAHP